MNESQNLSLIVKELKTKVNYIELLATNNTELNMRNLENALLELSNYSSEHLRMLRQEYNNPIEIMDDELSSIISTYNY